MEKNKQYGDLIRVYPSGKKEILLHAQPWGVLQIKRKEFIMRGVKRENLKITYQK